MQAGGYDGARYMTEMTDSLSLWNSTAKQSVENATWESVKRVYVDDQYKLGMSEYFEKRNPYARQVMLATLLDAAARGFWKATPKEKSLLAGELAKSASAHGLAGTADINRNTALTKTVDTAIAGLPGNEKLVREYHRAISDTKSKSHRRGSVPMKSGATAKPERSPSQTVTGMVLRNEAPRTGESKRRPNRFFILLLCVVVFGLVFIGWMRSARELA
jgi:cobalamin biosynthesis Mg chelatase CobN